MFSYGYICNEFSNEKISTSVAKDKIILKAWTSSIPNTNITVRKTTEISVEPTKKYGMPFYTNSNTNFS